MRDSNSSGKKPIEEVQALRPRKPRLERLRPEAAERKKAEVELKRSKEFLANVINALDDPVFVKDEEHRWAVLNDAACEVMGRPREELIGKSDYDLFPKEQADVFWERDNHVLNNGGTDVNEEEITWHGELHTISTKKSVFTDSLTGKKFIAGTIRDITERRKAEEALRESKDLLEKTFLSLHSAVFILDSENPPVIMDCNTAAYRLFGYEKQEMMGKTTEFLHVSTETILEFQKVLYPAIQKEGHLSFFEFRMKRKNGEIFPTEHSVIPLKDDKGNRTGWVSVVRDITERKKAEEKLRESEDKYRKVTENSLTGIFIHQDDKYVFVNDRFAEIHGYGREELLGKNFCVLIHPDDWEMAAKIRARRHAGEKVPLLYDIRRVKKDGETIWCQAIISQIEYKGRLATIGNVIDITKRKRTEEKEKKHFEQIQFLSRTAMELVEFPFEGNIYQFIGEKLKELVGDCFVTINSYDKASDSLCTRAVGGLGKHTKRFIEIMGRGPVGRCYPVNDEDGRRKLLTGRLVKGPEGLYELTFGEIPKGICRAIEELLGLRDIYAIGLTSEGELLGTAIVITRGAGGVRNQDIIETFIYQAGVALQRRLAVEALQRSKKDWETTFDAMSDWVVLMDLEGRILHSNRAGEEFTGASLAQMLGQSTCKLVHGTEKHIPACPLAKLLETGERVSTELQVPDTDRWLMVTVDPITDEEGKLTGVVHITRDITERKRAEEELRKVEQEKVTILNTMSELVVYQDTEHKVVWANQAVEESFGSTAEDLMGRHCHQIWHGRNKPCAGCPVEKVRKTGRLETGEITGLDGRTWSIRADPVKDKNGNVVGVVQIVSEVTERKRTEEKLLDYQAQLKSLASQLTLAEEHERRRIATELHDQISQSLVISKMKVDGLRESASGKELNKALDEIANSLGQTIAETRSLTSEIHSPLLALLGLEAAVAEWLTEQLEEKNGIATHFEDDGKPKPLDDDIRILLFRDVRELLTNIVRHANAQKVKVSIRKVGSRIRVKVEDDGVGFDLVKVLKEAVREGGFGLFSIRERLEEVGGRLKIESKPGHGTTVTIAAPLKAEKNAKGR